MKQYDKLLVILAITFTIIIGAICFRYEKKLKQQPPPTVEYKLVKKAVHDTVYIKEPQPSEVIYVPVPEYVDTAAIIADYYSYLVYVDTIHANEYIDIKITDSVYNNKLLAHQIEVLSLPEVYVPPNATTSRSLALGLLASKNLLATKCDFQFKRHEFSAGYDFINKAPLVGYTYKFIVW